MKSDRLRIYLHAIAVTAIVGTVSCDKEKLQKAMAGKTKSEIIRLCLAELENPIHIEVDHYTYEIKSVDDLTKFSALEASGFWEIQVSSGNLFNKRSSLGVTFNNNICVKAEKYKSRAI